MQRSLAARIDAERALRFAHPSGLIELKISEDALQNFQLRIDRLIAVMPSGLVVAHPQNTDIPVLDFRKHFETNPGGLQIDLAVPLSRPHAADVVDDLEDATPWRTARRYRVQMQKLLDENSGGEETTEVVRRVNAHLRIAGEPIEDLEVLPLVRLVLGVDEAGGGIPRHQEGWMPVCLVLSGSSSLERLVRDLSQQIEASRSDLAAKMSTAAYEVDNLQGGQIEQFFRLRTLSRFAVRLGSMCQGAQAASPLSAYTEMVECLAELRALSPGRDEGPIPAYNHQAIGSVFNELDKRIRKLLPGAVAQRFVKYDFTQAEGQFQAEIAPDAFGRAVGWYLGVSANMDANVLNQTVENIDNFRLLPPTMARRLVRGVPLEYDRVGSPSLPSRPGLYFYKLDTSDLKWTAIKDAAAAVVNFAEADEVDWKMSLYATLP